MRRFLVAPALLATALALAPCSAALAQEEEQEQQEPVIEELAAEDETSDTAETMEEIIVVAPKPGDRRRLDEEFEDPVKAQLLKDFYQMQEDQKEFAWRAAAAQEEPSRVSWGYDPNDEYRMRQELANQPLPSERTQPATLFRVKF